MYQQGLFASDTQAGILYTDHSNQWKSPGVPATVMATEFRKSWQSAYKVLISLACQVLAIKFAGSVPIPVISYSHCCESPTKLTNQTV